MRNIKWSVSVVCRRLSTKGLFFSGSKFPNPRWKPGCRCCVRGLPLKSAEATYCQLVIRELFSASEVFFSPANGFIKSTVITFVFVCVKPPVSDHSRWPRASVQTQLPPNRAASGLVSKKTKPKPFFLWRPWGFRELRQSVHKQTNTVAKSTYGTWSCTAGRAGSSSPSWFCSRAAWRILRGCKQAQFQRCQSLVCGTWDKMKTHTHTELFYTTSGVK